MLKVYLGPLPEMLHLGAERPRGPAHNTDPLGACCGGAPNTPSSPTLGLHLQPWSCTWGHQVLWCPRVDICSNSTCRISSWLRLSSCLGCHGPWPICWWDCLEYPELICQVGYYSRRGFQSPEANLAQDTGFQRPGREIHQVRTAFLLVEILVPLAV